jgi:CheY-like chemotaxis protein
VLDVTRILIVDDDVSVRSLLARYLAIDSRLKPMEAGNGAEALKVLREHRDIAAIVRDLRMPVMDGWAFRREQRRDPALSNIPVMVGSGADADRFHELDAVATFEKPVLRSDRLFASKGDLPTTRLSPIINTPWPRVALRIRVGSAPSAMRIPSSRRRLATSPDRAHGVVADRLVIRGEEHAFSDRLGDQNSVERILVQRRKRGQPVT